MSRLVRDGLHATTGFENHFGTPTWTQETFPKNKNASKRLTRRVTYPPRDLPPLPQRIQERNSSLTNDASEDITLENTKKVDRNLVDQYVNDINKFAHFNESEMGISRDIRCPYRMKRNSMPSRFRQKHKKTRFNSLGRHNPSGIDRRHIPCHLVAAYNDTASVVDSKNQLEGGERYKMEKESSTNINSQISSLHATVYEVNATKKSKNVEKWDEFVITKLSDDTAERLLVESTSIHSQERLHKFVALKKISKQDENVIVENKNGIKGSNLQHTLTGAHLSETNDATSTLNTTESSESDFLRQIQHGAQPLMKMRLNDTIVLDSDPKVLYRVNQQDVFPCEPNQWSNVKPIGDTSISCKLEKGTRKWKTYPSIVKDHMNNVTEYEIHSPQDFKSSLPNSELFSPRGNEISVVEILNEWRKQWLIEKKWEDVPQDELIKSMKDINNQVKFGAVSSCCQALIKAQTKTLNHHGSGFGTVQKRDISIGEVDDNLLAAVFHLIDDACKQVAMAASLTLSALNIRNAKALDILLNEAKNGTTLDKWTATQCLAVTGCTSDVVVKELINNTVSTDVKKSKRASVLLSRLSEKVESVQYMVAEQLNDLSYKERAMACHIVPLLKSKLSKDICHKLSHLMWNDWSSDVKEAAAVALGKTGQGKLVHDQLIHRLLSGKELIKLDALRRISNLGIMTTKLLSAFLKCFCDDHLAVRLQTLQTCTSLKLSDERVLQCLLHCAKQDESAKVKSEAWIAISNGNPSSDVVEAATWALCYEREAEVRISACVAIAKLEINGSDTIQTLQERIQVEHNDAVRMAIVDTLRRFNIEPTGDLSMRETVEKEVKCLCRKSNVANAIFRDENDELRQKMIGNAHLMEDYGELALKEAHLKDDYNSRPSTRGFDPVLEGFRIREKSVGVPQSSLFDMAKPYLPFEVNTDSSDDEHVDEDYE